MVSRKPGHRRAFDITRNQPHRGLVRLQVYRLRGIVPKPVVPLADITGPIWNVKGLRVCANIDLASRIAVSPHKQVDAVEFSGRQFEALATLKDKGFASAPILMWLVVSPSAPTSRWTRLNFPAGSSRLWPCAVSAFLSPSAVEPSWKFTPSRITCFGNISAG